MGRQKQAPPKLALLRLIRLESGWVRAKKLDDKTLTAQGLTTKRWEERIDRDSRFFGIAQTDAKTLGSYTVRAYENGKPKYHPGGETYVAAMKAFRRLSGEDTDEPQPVTPEQTGELSIAEQRDRYVAERQSERRITSADTAKKYELMVREFILITGVRYPSQVTNDVLTKYLNGIAEARLSPDDDKHLSPATIFNRYLSLSAVLSFADPLLAPMLEKRRPKAPEEARLGYYEPERLQELLAYLRSDASYDQRGVLRRRDQHRRDRRLALVAELFYRTGLRNGELGNLTWDVLKDGFIVKLDNRKFAMPKVNMIKDETGKKKLKKEGITKVHYRTKTRKDRKVDIPLGIGLWERLMAWKEEHKTEARYAELVFPTALGTVDTTLLYKLRTAVCQAGMTCGECDQCKLPCGRCQWCRCKACKDCAADRKCRNAIKDADNPCNRIECREWRIHAFRHSFGTTTVTHPEGDLALARDILGHADFRPTNRYVGVVERKKAQAKLSRVFGD